MRLDRDVWTNQEKTEIVRPGGRNDCFLLGRKNELIDDGICRRLGLLTAAPEPKETESDFTVTNGVMHQKGTDPRLPLGLEALDALKGLVSGWIDERLSEWFEGRLATLEAESALVAPEGQGAESPSLLLADAIRTGAGEVLRAELPQVLADLVGESNAPCQIAVWAWGHGRAVRPESCDASEYASTVTALGVVPDADKVGGEMVTIDEARESLGLAPIDPPDDEPGVAPAPEPPPAPTPDAEAKAVKAPAANKARKAPEGTK